MQIISQLINVKPSYQKKKTKTGFFSRKKKAISVSEDSASDGEEEKEATGPMKVGKNYKVDKITGEVAYKKVISSVLAQSIQLGMRISLGLRASQTSEKTRDLLHTDFDVVESLHFPK